MATLPHLSLYLLRPTDEAEKRWPSYDVTLGAVVRAEDESAARLLISQSSHGDEGAAVWLDPAQVTCVVVANEGERGVLITDFAAG